LQPPALLRWSALALGISSLAAALTLACGGGGDGGAGEETAITTTVSGSPQSVQVGGNDPNAAPLQQPPVSQFSILVQDLGIDNFLTDLSNTWDLTKELYANTGAFVDYDTGMESLTAWNYIQGYETALLPEGGSEAIFNGAYVVHQELHLFEDEDGAKEAFEYFRETVSNNGISSPLSSDTTIGSESFVSRTIAGKVGGNSHIDQVLHQVIFRRGNVVAVVLTIGAAPIMKVDTVLELGTIVDDKLLDEREHPQPTPIPGRDNEDAGAQPTPTP
jgi:hypothetical protein